MPQSTDGEGLVFPSFTTFPYQTEAGEDVRRLAAVVSSEQELWTFQDGVEHLLDIIDVGRTDRSVRMAKRAMLNAHRNLPTYHKWPYYQRLHVINTVDPYSTGTVEFDYSGGTYERLVTLTDGTFPAWAGFGTIRIGGVDYPVQQRISDTVLVISPARSPAEDLSDQGYTLFRSLYPLPLDFRTHDRIIDQVSGRELCLVSPSTATATTLHRQGLNTPDYASIVENERHIGGMALQIGAPSSATQYSFLYERNPRPMVTELYDTGTLTIVEDSAAITGVGTAFTRLHIGSVLRISSDDQPPTSRIGSLTSADDHPAAYTRIIMDVSGGTTLAVDETLGEDASGRAFTISDPIDVHVQSMLDAFLRLAEWEMARLLSRDDAPRRMAEFFAQLDVARNAVRHQTAIQNVNIGQSYSGWSEIGTVDVRTDL